MKHGFFITGTDTGIGKTHVSLVLLQALANHGLSTAAMKPVASGCQATPQGLRNDDALLLQQAATVPLPYEQVNPCAFSPAIAPHLAAEAAGISIDIAALAEQLAEIALQAEAVVVEGVGGWLVPLSAGQTSADLARCLGLPIILVVGIRLGCINHSLLTLAAIQQHQDNPPLVGWIANCIDAEMTAIDANIATLQERIDAPLLGTLPFIATEPETGIEPGIEAGIDKLIDNQGLNEKARAAKMQAGLLDINLLLSGQG